MSRSFSCDPGFLVDSSERENDGGVLPPRINQLDALALDQEMLATFHNYLADTFKFFLKYPSVKFRPKITWTVRSPLDYVGPEVEALLRLVIWGATHWAKGTSVRSCSKAQQLTVLDCYIGNNYYFVLSWNR